MNKYQIRTMNWKTNISLAFIFTIYSHGLLASSFDCTKANQEIELAICENETLSSLDKRLSKIYFYLKAALNAYEIEESKSLLSQQRKWLKTRKKTCPSLGSQCLIEQYQARIEELEQNYMITTLGNSFDFSGAPKSNEYCSIFLQNYAIFKRGQKVCPTQIRKLLDTHNISCEYHDDWDGERNEAICTLAQLIYEARPSTKSYLNANPIAPPSTLPVVVDSGWSEEKGERLLMRTLEGEEHSAPLSKNLPAQLKLLLRADFNGDGFEDAIYIVLMHDSGVREIALMTRTDPTMNRLLYNSRRIYCAIRDNSYVCEWERGLGYESTKRISCGVCPG